MDGDEPTASTDRIPGYRIVSTLQTVGVGLLVLGFSGWVLDDGGEVSFDSPFTLAFGVGVVCALASIYLGILLSNRD